MGNRQAKSGTVKGKRAAARDPRQMVITVASPANAPSRRKRQQARLVQRPLVEDSAYKLGDLEGVKEEWSDRLLLPSIGRGARPASATISYKPEDNVMAIGVGEKYVAGKPTGVLALKFLIRSKKDRNLVLSKHLLPKSVQGMPVDVEQVGVFRSSNTVPNPQAAVRPARPGCSVGFVPPVGNFAEVGTFGALVRRGSALFILSNNHVLADENNLTLGTPIFQPSVLDDPNFGSHEIARLFAYAELLHGVPNTVDCAIAQVTNPSLVSNSILHIGTPSGTVAPSMGMQVHKFGRSSGYTVGSISMIGTNVRLEYDTNIFMFRNQIIIRSATNAPFSEKGDSGALVVERGTQRAVGLLVGRNSDGASGVANPITAVLQRLNVTLA